MSEVEPRAAAIASPSSDLKGPRLGRGLKLAVVGAIFVGALGVLYVTGAALTKPGSGGDGLRALATGSMAKLQAVAEPVAAPSTLFVDGQGAPMRLSAFRGRAVVLNLWATWCAPCKSEMPTLAKLQAAYAGKALAVVAVSMDQGGQRDAASAFIAQHAPLAFYQDAKYAFLSDLKPHLQGFPTTVLFDRSGVERAVMMGDTDWSTPEAHKVIDKLLAM